MSMQMFSGFTIIAAGALTAAIGTFSEGLLSLGIIQIAVGSIILQLTDDEIHNRNILLVLNLTSFILGFGLFIGPFIGLIGLYGLYFEMIA